MYTLEKNKTSPLSILCTLIPQTIPLLTLTFICTRYEESTPREARTNSLEMYGNRTCTHTLRTTQEGNDSALANFEIWQTSACFKN